MSGDSETATVKVLSLAAQLPPDVQVAALWLGKLLAGKSEDEQQAILAELRARIAAAELTNRRAAEG